MSKDSFRSSTSTVLLRYIDTGVLTINVTDIPIGGSSTATHNHALGRIPVFFAFEGEPSNSFRSIPNVLGVFVDPSPVVYEELSCDKQNLYITVRKFQESVGTVQFTFFLYDYRLSNLV